MIKHALSLMCLLFWANIPMFAQTDSLPKLGGILYGDSVELSFHSLGERSTLNRSGLPGCRHTLLDKAIPFNQRCELSCASTAPIMAAMLRLKMYCNARCKCNSPFKVLSWSWVHNQLVKRYGEKNIFLKYSLDLIKEQGIPPADDFQNTPCSHDHLPSAQDKEMAKAWNYWTYEPAFKARHAFTGPKADSLFQAEAIYRTIAWLEQDIPVVIGFLATDNFRRLKKENCLWQAPTPLTGALGHACVVTGYDDCLKRFELLNSFGGDWGCGGVAYVSYPDFGQVIREGYVLLFDFDKGRPVCTKK